MSQRKGNKESGSIDNEEDTKTNKKVNNKSKERVVSEQENDGDPSGETDPKEGKSTAEKITSDIGGSSGRAGLVFALLGVTGFLLALVVTVHNLNKQLESSKAYNKRTIKALESDLAKEQEAHESAIEHNMHTEMEFKDMIEKYSDGKKLLNKQAKTIEKVETDNVKIKAKLDEKTQAFNQVKIDLSMVRKEIVTQANVVKKQLTRHANNVEELRAQLKEESKENEMYHETEIVLKQQIKEKVEKIERLEGEAQDYVKQSEATTMQIMELNTLASDRWKLAELIEQRAVKAEAQVQQYQQKLTEQETQLNTLLAQQLAEPQQQPPTPEPPQQPQQQQQEPTPEPPQQQQQQPPIPEPDTQQQPPTPETQQPPPTPETQQPAPTQTPETQQQPPTV